MRIPRPNLPFSGFKWRWATFQPTEGLNARPVYLGVLRALASCEGESPSSEHLRRELERVESEAFQGRRRRIELARPNERNLIRNSGQYWKAFGLLGEATGRIELTAEGRAVANGEITPNEFADRVIRDLTLPNPRVQSEEEMRPWREANLVIRPLRLVLEVLLVLRARWGAEDATLTVGELVTIVIPGSGSEWTPEQIATTVIGARSGRVDTSDWPNVTPSSNDERMAAEFLIFLAEYGFLEFRVGASRRLGTYRLREAVVGHVERLCALPASPPGTSEPMPPDLFTPRARRASIVRVRPNQDAFRSSVRAAWNSTCALTQETTPEALIAAHIIPVEEDGNDDPDNGILLRADVHILFDEQLIRIDKNGSVFKHPRIASAPSYIGIERRIPVSEARCRYLEWRWRYL
jgi:hypothetical protein